ncbi:hypothetical protein GYH30_001283 [Glycine max]|nr:hypothetical protein GYH30_001283 [Glycine max]
MHARNHISNYCVWRNMQTQKEIMFELVVLQKALEITNEMCWD